MTAEDIVTEPVIRRRAWRWRGWHHRAGEFIVLLAISLALTFVAGTLLGMWARVAWEGIMIGWRILS